MSNLILPFLVIAAVFVLVAVMKAFEAKDKEGKKKPSLPYETRKVLLSPAELAFARVLETAVGPSIRVTAKVRLEDVIAVKGGLDQSARQSARNKIQSKHLDFVLCARENWHIVAAVELDDASHRRANRQKRDVFLNEALAAAGVPLLRFPARESYAVEEIQAAISAQRMKSAQAPAPS